MYRSLSCPFDRNGHSYAIEGYLLPILCPSVNEYNIFPLDEACIIIIKIMKMKVTKIIGKHRDYHNLFWNVNIDETFTIIIDYISNRKLILWNKMEITYLLTEMMSQSLDAELTEETPSRWYRCHN